MHGCTQEEASGQSGARNNLDKHFLEAWLPGLPGLPGLVMQLNVSRVLELIESPNCGPNLAIFQAILARVPRDALESDISPRLEQVADESSGEGSQS